MKNALLLIALFLTLIWGCASQDGSSFKILSQSKHPDSKYRIVVEDYTNYFWASLYEGNSLSPICSCFVGATMEPYKEVEMPAPFNGNPPISEKYASKQAIIASISKESIQFRWSNNGKIVVVNLNNDPVCMLDGIQKSSYSKAVKKDGSYGKPWNQVAFKNKIESTI